MSGEQPASQPRSDLPALSDLTLEHAAAILRLKSDVGRRGLVEREPDQQEQEKLLIYRACEIGANAIDDLQDARSALRYIEQVYGRVYGVGWDRLKLNEAR